MHSYSYRTYTFWLLVIVITWVSGLAAAFFSYSETLNGYQIPFILIGMFTPFIISSLMIYNSRNNQLKSNYRARILNLKLVKPKFWAFILLLMPMTLVLATSLSLLFGQPSHQFLLAPELNAKDANIIVLLIILVGAPTFEELGWRGYGIDSLKKGNTILKTTIIFTFLWLIWHLPLFAIKDYYQNELLHMNLVYALNFMVSLFPAAFLMSWIYFKNNRSIIAIIIFHMMLNLFSVLFQTEQFTKCIITLMLLAISVYIFYSDKKFWTSK